MTVQRRSDHNIQLVFKDSNNAAIDLTGYTVEAQVWEETRTTKYADFGVTYTDRASWNGRYSTYRYANCYFFPKNF